MARRYRQFRKKKEEDPISFKRYSTQKPDVSWEGARSIMRNIP